MSERPGEMDRFAIDCALRAAWVTELWIPGEPDFRYTDYFEAAAARNIGLLHGFEELAEDIEKRGILPQGDSDQARLVTDGGQVEDPYAGWVCDGCGKHVTGSMPVDQCSDCGGRWFEATPDRLACDRCGDQDASSVFNSEHNRLCDSCIGEENISMYGDRLADAAKVMRGEADELAARDDVDDHMTDVIEGLRHHAGEIEEFLQEEYYR